MADEELQPERPRPDETVDSSNEMADYLQIFLDESDDELEALVQALLTLEDDPRAREALDEAFRLLHTLKGSSGMMGFEPISELAHELENRFETFRTGRRTLDKATMNVILECVDFFRAYNTGLRQGHPPQGDAGDLIARLAELDTSPPDAGSARSTDSAASTDAADRSPQTLSLDGAYRVRVQFQPGLQLADLKARLIVARLSQIGEIVATDPPIEEIQSVDDLSGFAVIVMCNRGPDEVRKIADVDGVEAVVIDGGMSPPVEPQPLAAPPDGTSTPQQLPTAVITPPGSKTSAAEGLEGGVPAVLKTSADTKSTNAASAAAGGDAEAASPTSDFSTRNVAKDVARTAVSETIRVDIDRLDRLMNLTGELVVTRARLTSIANGMRAVFRNRTRSPMARNLGERLQVRLQTIKSLLAAGDSDATGWSHVISELENVIVGLDEQSSAWEEGRRRYHQLGEAVDQLNRVSDNLQRGILETRMVPVAPLFNRFRRVIRDLSKDRDKQVQLVIRGENTELDKRMIDELGDPLIHLVRNSIDHGLETPAERERLGKPTIGTIQLEAFHNGNNVMICIRDDGSGINVDRIRKRLRERGLATEDELQQMSETQIIEFIWHPGFSTADTVTDLSGRGVGMDVVRRRITELNGSIEVDSVSGQGTTFTIRLPLTLAIIQSLLVRFRRNVFSIPIDDVREIVSVPARDVYMVRNCRTIEVRGKLIPVVGMEDVFEWNRSPDGDDHATSDEVADDQNASAASLNVVILRHGDKAIGLCVDELLGGTDIVIKSLADNFTDIRGLTGASVMGDGTVCLMLDVKAIAELAAERAQRQAVHATMTG